METAVGAEYDTIRADVSCRMINLKLGCIYREYSAYMQNRDREMEEHARFHRQNFLNAFSQLVFHHEQDLPGILHNMGMFPKDISALIANLDSPHHQEKFAEEMAFYLKSTFH